MDSFQAELTANAPRGRDRGSMVSKWVRNLRGSGGSESSEGGRVPPLVRVKAVARRRESQFSLGGNSKPLRRRKSKGKARREHTGSEQVSCRDPLRSRETPGGGQQVSGSKGPDHLSQHCGSDKLGEPVGGGNLSCQYRRWAWPQGRARYVAGEGRKWGGAALPVLLLNAS